MAAAKSENTTGKSARTRLVEGMADLLWERGYVGTSPAAVLERTGVGQGSLYHHFAGKPDLAVEGIRLNALTLTRAADEALTGEGTAYERLERFLLRDRDVLRGCRIGRMTQDPEVFADASLRQPVSDALSGVREAIATVIREGQERGELATSTAPDDLAATILATLQGGYVLARADLDDEPFHAAIRGVLAFLQAVTGEEHWHGATARSGMSHLAIQEHDDGGGAATLERVAPYDYPQEEEPQP